ncbi:PAS domain-containing protein [Carboxylicivirga sp. M1479]|uniref:PAS domain-containing protein n=1 Tax=Carboxylicivirga sp. M1479 TaxID=2594476 RepID=UPI001177A979|nr:PAS domain-containing protein [Carboxylicivirga sp. M1479]TRX72057.1 PAS domain S-box protein [Carboxylicivirga sp. M1479]
MTVIKNNNWDKQLWVLQQLTIAKHLFVVRFNKGTYQTIAKTSDEANWKAELQVVYESHKCETAVLQEGEPCFNINVDLPFTKSIAYYPIAVDKQCWGLLILMSEQEDAHLLLDLSLILSTVKNFENELILEHQSINQHSFVESDPVMTFLLDSMNGVPWRLDFKSGKYTYLGAQSKKVLGFTMDDWPDLESWKACIHPEDAEWALNYCFECSVNNEDHLFEYRLVQKDGSIVWVRDVVSVITNSNGEVIELIGFMINISDLKNKEQELREANALLHSDKQLLNAFINSIQSFAFMKDLNGNWLLTNQFYETFFGIPEQEFKGKRLERFLPAHLASEMRQQEQKATESGESNNFEFSLSDSKGKKRWFYASYFPVFDTEGEVDKLCGTSVDITKRKEFELETERLHDQLNFVLNATNTHLCIIDDVGNIVFNTERPMHGGEKCFKHFRNRTEKCEECPRQNAVKRRKTFYYSLPGEEAKNIQVTALPYETSDGKLYMAEVRVDISDRIKAEAEIKLLNEQLNMSMSASQIAFVEYDLNNYTYKVADYLKNIIDFDLNGSKIDLSWLESRIHNNDIGVAKFKIHQLINKKQEKVQFEFRFLNHNQKYIWLNIHLRTISSENGQVNCVYGIIQNINDYKSLVRELEQERNKSKMADDAKTNFLANMSHEIRTPMNAILGFSEILNKTLPNGVSKNYLKSIKTSGKVLMSLINDILDVSKIEADKLVLKLETIDFKQLISEIAETFVFSANEKSLELNLIHPTHMPAGLVLDEIRIKQILLNLINNAVKYTHEGHVNISYCYTKSEQENTGQLYINVEDTGVGIKKEKQKSIFDPFEQEEKSINKHIQGTGLGLSIIHKLVKLMNGSITLKSIEGHGSSFSIVLPKIEHKSSIDKSDDLPVVVPNYKGKKALVVDDVASNQEVLDLFLNDVGIETTAISTGRNAVDLMEHNIYDVVLLDINMPDMNGFDVLELIGKSNNCHLNKVLAVTAASLDHEIENMINKGFAGVVTKPIDANSLYTQLSKIIDQPNALIQDVHLEKEEDISLSDDDRQELIKTIDENLMPLWNLLSKRQASKDLSEFNSKLKQVVDNYPLKKLIDYQIQLDLAIKSFDFEAIAMLLPVFKKLTQQL